MFGNIEDFKSKIEQRTVEAAKIANHKNHYILIAKHLMKKKHDEFYLKIAMKALKRMQMRARTVKRKQTYLMNKSKRKFLTQCFTQFRDICHEEAVKRVKQEAEAFRTQLQREKLSALSSKVDQMMTYLGLLEDKIKREQEARIQITEVYNKSLNKGVTTLH